MTVPTGAASAALAAAFKSALLNQGEVVFMIFVLLAIAWVTCRELLLAKAKARLTFRLAASRADRVPEPTARQVVRIGFGILWIFDGLLQAQPTMPGDLPSHVIGPAAAGSPGWVLHTVGWAATAWSAHPVEAAAGAVWIQLGIGVWLLSATSTRWSRAGGLMSIGWGLVVWVFGEAFGSLFAPGATWLMGAPGAALFYSVAGLLLALPLTAWHDPRLGRWVLQVSGALMLAFAVLQAWPGRGYWQGRLHGQSVSLAAAIGAMAAGKQPTVLHRLVGNASLLVASHGFAVNLGTVIVLAATGGCLLTGRAAFARPAAIVAIAICVTDWVFVQDLGFFGGVGTDPNSMLPQALLLTAGLVAMAPVRAAVVLERGVVDHAPADAAPAGVHAEPTGTLTWRSGRPPGRAVRAIGVALGMASASTVLALWAGAMVILGAVPLAVATVQRGPAQVVSASHPHAAVAIRPAVAAPVATGAASPLVATRRSEAAAADRRAEGRLPGFR